MAVMNILIKTMLRELQGEKLTPHTKPLISYETKLGTAIKLIDPMLYPMERSV